MQQRLQADPLLLFDPRGKVREAVSPIAARKRTLEGLRLGVLDNSKWNANKILRGTSSALSCRVRFAAVNYYVKESFSKDAAAELIERIARDNDIVLTAIGDCGSCCSCCIRDAIALEQAGLPSAAIITSEFVVESALTRTALGMAGLPVVVVDHPVSSITAAEIASRVAAAAAQAEEVWLGRTPPPPA
jgi:hypothetical protein